MHQHAVELRTGVLQKARVFKAREKFTDSEGLPFFRVVKNALILALEGDEVLPNSATRRHGEGFPGFRNDLDCVVAVIDANEKIASIACAHFGISTFLSAWH